MNNGALSGLRYTGVVTLSQYINGKKRIIGKVKNTGGLPLFDFFTDCLIGNYDTAQFNRPSKIMLLKHTKQVDTNGNESAELVPVSGFIYMINRPEKVTGSELFGSIIDTDVASAACLSFLVPATAISETFTHIGLYTDSAGLYDIDNYAALVPVDIANFNFTSESVLLLDWYLIVSNS